MIVCRPGKTGKSALVALPKRGDDGIAPPKPRSHPPSMPTPAAPDEAPRVVLDTNVVLDWLYFRDPRSAALGEAVTTGCVRWIAGTAMRDEIERVLARGELGRKWPGGAASVRNGWQRWAMTVEAAPPLSPAALRCSDADDQKFIDLALAVRAAFLLSADRAVLRLARAARERGLLITTVERWRLRAPP
jgi:predicted nucleic acid-binding protein